MKQAQVEEAYKTIMDGGLAIIPSRVGYTLLGNSEQAIQKMYRIKARPSTKPCVILTHFDLLFDVASVPSRHTPFIKTIHEQGLLCGFILKRAEHPLFSSLSEFTDMNSKRPDNTSCYVIHGGEYIEYLVNQSVQDKTFIVGSSANQSGTGNEGVFNHIPESIRSEVDYEIEDDAYVHQEYNPQTRAQGVMVDLTGDVGFVIREGLQTENIRHLLDEHNHTLLNEMTHAVADELL